MVLKNLPFLEDSDTFWTKLRANLKRLYLAKCNLSGDRLVKSAPPMTKADLKVIVYFLLVLNTTSSNEELAFRIKLSAEFQSPRQSQKMISSTWTKKIEQVMRENDKGGPSFHIFWTSWPTRKAQGGRGAYLKEPVLFGFLLPEVKLNLLHDKLNQKLHQ